MAIPQLTEERRKELVKIVNKKSEEAKVAIRNIRRDGNDVLKKEEKNSDVTIFATHGHVYNPHKLPMLKDGDILLNGHTHIPACEEILDMNGGKYQYLNPGSVSIPKEGSEHSYMIYENGVFTWKNLAGEEYQTWKTVSHS